MREHNGCSMSICWAIFPQSMTLIFKKNTNHSSYFCDLVKFDLERNNIFFNPSLASFWLWRRGRWNKRVVRRGFKWTRVKDQGGTGRLGEEAEVFFKSYKKNKVNWRKLVEKMEQFSIYTPKCLVLEQRKNIQSCIFIFYPAI